MSFLFDSAISIVALRSAFDKCRRIGGSPGGDGVSIAKFGRNAEAQLASLHMELVDQVYSSGPLRRVKRSGGVRTLSIPCVADRVVQGAVASLLSIHLDTEFSKDSFAYRPGRSVKQAIARVSALRRMGYDHIVDGDIRAFFDEVPHDILLTKLDAHFDEPRLLSLISLWLDEWGTAMGTIGRGLAQGSPLSPLLANLYLDSLDDAFEHGPVRIVRFADDFLLLCRTQKNAEKALIRARDHLAQHGLHLNLEKSKIVSFDDAFDFLGHLFVRSVVLEQQWADEQEAEPLPPFPRKTDLPSGSESALPPDGPIAISSTEIPHDDLPIEEDPIDDDILAALTGGRQAEEFAAGLAPLYLMEPDINLTINGESFSVERNGETVLRIPAVRVGRIDLGPRVDASIKAIRLAADHEVPISFVDGRGAAKATLCAPESDYAGLHLKQAQRSLNEEQSLAQVQILVATRIRNARSLLKRLNQRRKKEAVVEACKGLDRLRRKALYAKDISKCRGFEGAAGRIYWPALGACLERGFALKKRRDAPGNPVTNVLDFTASLLTRDMATALTRAGLHSGFGTLHSTSDYRDALAYDLVEAFRAPLSEGLTIYMFNNRILSQDDFLKSQDANDWDGRARLINDAPGRLIRTYEKWMARPIKNPHSGDFTSWRSLLLEESYAYAHALKQSVAHQPYQMDY